MKEERVRRRRKGKRWERHGSTTKINALSRFYCRLLRRWSDTKPAFGSQDSVYCVKDGDESVTHIVVVSKDGNIVPRRGMDRVGRDE